MRLVLDDAVSRQTLISEHSNGMPENMINSIGNDKVQKICTVAVQKDRGNFMCYVDRSGNSWTSTFCLWRPLRVSVCVCDEDTWIQKQTRTES